MNNNINLEGNIFYVNIFDDITGIKELFSKVYDDFKGYI